MNPLHWKREHQLAWLLTSLLGAFSISYYHWSYISFWGWVYADLWWYYPMSGFVVTGVIFYTVRLCLS